MEEIFIKVAAQPYERLRSRIPSQSPAHKAVAQATRIPYSLDGVQFDGYHLHCDEGQARILLETARERCPEIVEEIHKAIAFTGSGC